MLLYGQPRVKYVHTGILPKDVRVITPDQAAFEAELKVFLANPKTSVGHLAEIRPYIVILKNESKETINMALIVWEGAYRDRPHTVSSIFMNARSRSSASQFSPGRVFLAFPLISVIGPSLAVGLQRPALPLAVAVLAGASEVTVSVEAVIFESGRIIGADEGGLSVRYEAERQALRDMDRDLSKLIADGPDTRAIKAYLAELAGLKVQPNLYLPDCGRNFQCDYDRTRQSYASTMVRQPDALILQSVQPVILQMREKAATMKDLFRD